VLPFVEGGAGTRDGRGDVPWFASFIRNSTHILLKDSSRIAPPSLDAESRRFEEEGDDVDIDLAKPAFSRSSSVNCRIDPRRASISNRLVSPLGVARKERRMFVTSRLVVDSVDSHRFQYESNVPVHYAFPLLPPQPP
jgi:hypothetical protein